MPKARTVVFTLALVWILLKLIFYFLNESELGYTVGVLANMLFVLVVIAATLWLRFRIIRPEQSNFLIDFKEAVKQAGIYILIVCGFLLLYYKAIDGNFLENRVVTQLEANREFLSDPENLAEVIQQNPLLEGKTANEILEMEEEGKRRFLNPWTTFTLSLIGLLMLAVFYGLITTALFRKVWSSDGQQ